MDRPPYFAFYPVDFASDINVEAMSTLQVGAYVLLLCKAWQADPPASLPNDDQILARFARVDADTWREMRPGVLNVFRLGSDNRLHNKRLRQEYDAALTRMKANREKTEKARVARWAANTNREATLKQPSSVTDSVTEAAHISELSVTGGDLDLESENINTRKKTPHSPPQAGGGVDLQHQPARRPRKPAAEHPLFAEFWAAYPRKVAKPAALAAFSRLDPPPDLLAAILAAIGWQRQSPGWTKDGGAYIPHPATWLNGRRWEDELPKSTGPPPQPRRGYESHDERIMREIAEGIKD